MNFIGIYGAWGSALEGPMIPNIGGSLGVLCAEGEKEISKREEIE
jgi:hypothetical protein